MVITKELNCNIYPSQGFMSACSRVGIDVNKEMTIDEQSDLLSIPLNGLYAIYEYGRLVGRNEA